jgi:plastocyanin
MRSNTIGARSSRITGDDVLAIGCTVVLLALFSAVVAWAMREGDRESRAALIAATAPPRTFDVSTGWESAAGPVEEFAAYYPARLIVHPQDVVRFTNPTADVPHSVTFGLRADRANQPIFGTGDPLPIVNGPCVSDRPLTPSSSACDWIGDASELPPFDGQAFFNSGIIPPAGGAFELHLSSDLPPGEYSFFCVIHPAQAGALEVVPEGEPTQQPERLERDTTSLLHQDRSEADRFAQRSGNGSLIPADGIVVMGAATARASRNEFYPSVIDIDAGDSITWTNGGPVPHVAIFGGSLAPPVAAATPPTRPSGSTLAEGLFTTGPVGAVPYPRTTFTLRFDAPGQYSYVCTFHPGMAGRVNVR